MCVCVCVCACVSLWVCVCMCARACTCVCVHACARMLRIVSVDKILRFTNSLIINYLINSNFKHTTNIYFLKTSEFLLWLVHSVSTKQHQKKAQAICTWTRWHWNPAAQLLLACTLTCPQQPSSGGLCVHMLTVRASSTVDTCACSCAQRLQQFARLSNLPGWLAKSKGTTHVVSWQTWHQMISIPLQLISFFFS